MVTRQVTSDGIVNDEINAKGGDDGKPATSGKTTGLSHERSRTIVTSNKTMAKTTATTTTKTELVKRSA